ncbi:hypothetical protein [Nocardioides sp. SR21]|uniref:hypothetical protein n=1 Tax=Nocardioides sp. SR21 TaxID=2919501 RepID=UPI001FA97EA3|nr:hypothetical protein [Nocardioides sp. SR21]
MTPEDAVRLCRYVKACCPQQAIDELTPLAWADHLADVPYEDAKAAAKEITARQPFVTIAEILAIVRRIRAKRITEAGDLTPPPGTEAEQRTWLALARRRIADGGTVDCDAAYGELKPRYLPDIRELMPAPDRPEETADA